MKCPEARNSESSNGESRLADNCCTEPMATGVFSMMRRESPSNATARVFEIGAELPQILRTQSEICSMFLAFDRFLITVAYHV